MKEIAINLKKVFIYEAQISTQLEIYARVAQKEDMSPLISKNLTEIAEQMKEHAYWIFYTLLQFKKEDFVEGLRWDEEKVLNTMKELQEFGIMKLENDEIIIPGIIQEKASDAYSL